MLMRFDPFAEFDRLTSPVTGRGLGPVDSFVAVDAYRSGDHYVVSFDLPGVDPGSIELTVEQNVLSVSAQRAWLPEEGAEVLFSERPQGSFTRRLQLGDGFDTERIEARYEHGVLMVLRRLAASATGMRIEIRSPPAPWQFPPATEVSLFLGPSFPVLRSNCRSGSAIPWAALARRWRKAGTTPDPTLPAPLSTPTMDWSRRSTGDLPGAAGIRCDERVVLVAPPRKGELAGSKSVDGAGDDAAAGDRGRVAGCDQADPPTVEEGLVGLVGAGDLGADDRGAASAVVGGQPVVAQRSGALGEGEEGLLQQIVEVH